MSTTQIVAVIQEPLELYDICITDGAGNPDLIYEYTTRPAVIVEITADVPPGFVAHVSIQETNGETITPCGFEVPIFEPIPVPEPGVGFLLAGALLLAALKRGKR